MWTNIRWEEHYTNTELLLLVLEANMWGLLPMCCFLMSPGPCHGNPRGQAAAPWHAGDKSSGYQGNRFSHWGAAAEIRGMWHRVLTVCAWDQRKGYKITMLCVYECATEWANQAQSQMTVSDIKLLKQGFCILEKQNYYKKTELQHRDTQIHKTNRHLYVGGEWLHGDGKRDTKEVQTMLRYL